MGEGWGFIWAFSMEAGWTLNGLSLLRLQLSLLLLGVAHRPIQANPTSGGPGPAYTFHSLRKGVGAVPGSSGALRIATLLV